MEDIFGQTGKAPFFGQTSQKYERRGYIPLLRREAGAAESETRLASRVKNRALATRPVVIGEIRGNSPVG